MHTEGKVRKFCITSPAVGVENGNRAREEHLPENIDHCFSIKLFQFNLKSSNQHERLAAPRHLPPTDRPTDYCSPPRVADWFAKERAIIAITDYLCRHRLATTTDRDSSFAIVCCFRFLGLPRFVRSLVGFLCWPGIGTGTGCRT